MNKYLVAPLVVICFILGLGTGFYLSPWYSQGNIAHSQGLGYADSYFDLRYLNAMASHHQGAILLAEQAKANSSRTEVLQLADMIIQNEPKLIQSLVKLKLDFYKDSSPIPTPKVPNLGQKSDNFDLRLLNALIFHHQEGIEMAKEAGQKSSRGEILDDASGVQEFLQNSLFTLKTWRLQWYQK